MSPMWVAITWSIIVVFSFTGSTFIVYRKDIK
jgi:hypothetical protein